MGDGTDGHWLVRMEWRPAGVSASVNLPMHHKVQKFSSGTGSPGWSRTKARKTVVVVCCCQTAGWIKMPLGSEAGLGLGNILLDGDSAPPP